jgi:hypothetical protein
LAVRPLAFSNRGKAGQQLPASLVQRGPRQKPKNLHRRNRSQNTAEAVRHTPPSAHASEVRSCTATVDEGLSGNAPSLARRSHLRAPTIQIQPRHLNQASGSTALSAIIANP